MKIKRVKRDNPLRRSFAEAIASVEAQVEYRKLAVVEELLQYMNREGINRSELAERMGVGPSRITAMLNGSNNLTIETLVRAGHAVGADLQQAFVPKGQTGHWIASSRVRSGGGNSLVVDFVPRAVAPAPAPQLSNTQTAERDAEDAA